MGRVKGYFEVVRSLNDALAARQPFQAISNFAAAAVKDPDGAAPHAQHCFSPVPSPAINRCRLHIYQGCIIRCVVLSG